VLRALSRRIHRIARDFYADNHPREMRQNNLVFSQFHPQQLVSGIERNTSNIHESLWLRETHSTFELQEYRQ
jgi:hypothetical protein